MTGLASYRAAYVDRLGPDDLMGAADRLMFVFAGIFIGLPPQYTEMAKPAAERS